MKGIPFMVYDQKRIEQEILEFWEKNRVPQRLAEQRKAAKPFFLLDGPPYANAEAHVGHVKTTASKDVWSRYLQMKGFSSYLQPGFDCHGLPTEVMVEKELGIKSKQDIEKIGIETFDAKCLEKVVNTEKSWMQYYRLLGAWRHYFEPYFTYKDYYIESGWWTVKRLQEKGLLVQGTKSVYWCPHCETTLSGYEVSDSYKDVEDPSIFVKFKVKKGVLDGKSSSGQGTDGLKETPNEFLLVWTTTPWTLPSNVAIAAHPAEKYVRARLGKEVFVFAEKRLAFLEEKLKAKFETLESFEGKKLDGLEYEPVFTVGGKPIASLAGHQFRVIMSISILTHKKYKKHHLKHATRRELSEEKQLEQLTGTEEKEEYAEFVSMNEGTGLVHSAPGHGQTDHFVGKHYGLPAPSPVDEKGRFTEEVYGFAGRRVKEADKDLIQKLQEEGKLLHSETVVHRAALCWRCKTPLVFRLSKQWYLQVEPIKDKMISENEKVEWLPSYGKEKFYNWLVDREDWCISQQRYWGIPLPIWVCKKCGNYEVIGSRKELVERGAEMEERHGTELNGRSVGGKRGVKVQLSDLQDLHRHAVDGITLKCSKCGGVSERVRDILNVWFDSGIAPWASLGHPFCNKELFENMFPADLINESQDQIRGWFDSLMFLSVAVFGKAPYKTVAMNGWVLDEKGEKMSKSLGNVIPAREGIEHLSADVIRMYYCYEVAPWEVQKFSLRTAGEVQKAFGILYNSLSFYETYSQGMKVPEKLDGLNLEKEDDWIASRLESLTGQVTRHLDGFERHLAGRALVDFIVNDFSRTYIKLVRDRAGLEAEAKSRLAALGVLRHCLLAYSKLLAPISPFLSEHVYQKLKGSKGRESVHYEDWPVADAKRVRKELEEAFEVVERITEAVNSARQEAGLKKRWPLPEVVVSGEGRLKGVVAELQSVLRRSCNADAVRYAEEEQLKMLGKEFVGGKVFVPKQLNPEFLREAFFRELVRAIQAARKKEGLQVQEKIALKVFAEKETKEFLESRRSVLLKEVGASEVEFASSENELGNVLAEASLEEWNVKVSFGK